MRRVLLCPLSTASAENVLGFRSFWLGNAVRHMVELQVSALPLLPSARSHDPR